MSLITAVSLATAAFPLGAQDPGAQDPGATSARIRLVTTTSTRDSGLLDHLLPLLSRDTGIEVDVVAVGSGHAFAHARRGDGDLFMTHEPDGERELVADGIVRARRPFMFNDFVIVGPTSDPAGLAGLGDSLEAYRRLAGQSSSTVYQNSATVYLSRGDGSGTHRKEQRLLAAAGIEPAVTWCLETGQGMGATLTQAWEREAYTLSDRATHVAHRRARALPVLVEGDARLENVYSLMVPRPEVHPHVQAEAAERVAAWLMGEAGLEAISSFRRAGRQLFFPLDLGLVAEHDTPPDSNNPGNTDTDADADRNTDTAPNAGVLGLIFSGSRDVWGPAFLTLRCAALAALLAAPFAVPLGIFIGSGRGRLKRGLRALVEAGLAIPTTAVALLLYLLLSRGGWFGEAGLLYTPTAIVLGQLLVALPVMLLLTSDATRALDARAALTARTLGASPLRRGLWLALEIRGSVVAALFAAFGRAAGEIGVALILGGNIRDRTRTLTTAIHLETSRGEFEQALALGVLLVGLAFATILIVRLLSPGRRQS